MRSSFLPFSRPSITEADIEAVAAVLRSGWITTGPNVARFEEELCAAVGCAGAVAVASATAGMHLLYSALDLGEGDEVVTPSMTWVSTVNLAVLCGARPVFVDVDPETLLVTPEAVEAAITPRTRLVIPVHYAGVPVDLDPIREVCAAHPRVRLVEDAAHALGTRYRGEPVGARGTAVFSFHPIKNVTTGEGGMVCSEDAELLDRVRRLRFHGLGVDAYDRRTQGRKPQAEVQEPGWKYNLTDIQAALGLGQLARLGEMNARRAALAERYLERLAGLEGIRPLGFPAHDHAHAWHLFIVRVDEERAGLSRDAFMKALEERNIGTGIHFRAVHGQRWYREHLDLAPDALPATTRNSERICSLPLFPDMTPSDVDDVVEAIQSALAVEAR